MMLIKENRETTGISVNMSLVLIYYCGGNKCKSVGAHVKAT